DNYTRLAPALRRYGESDGEQDAQGFAMKEAGGV
ncbi:MAG: hypothetical protein ACI8VY_000577, partial [Cellvibrionaceae bacterium]